MSLLIKCINYCLLVIVLFSCGGGPEFNDDDWDDLSDDVPKGTCLKGTLVDTVGGIFPILGAQVSTIPSVDETVTTNDEGIFFICSDEFLEDVKYNISIQARGFIPNSPSNIKVRLDTLMDLRSIVLTRMPKIGTDIDNIKIGGTASPDSL